MRNIRELRNLPISEMTDEEILKAAHDRLGTNCCMLIYNSPDDFKIIILGRYAKDGRIDMMRLKTVFENIYGSMKSLKDADEEI